MVVKIEHIGVAVRNLEKSLEPYTKYLGLVVEKTEEILIGGGLVRVAFLPVRDTEIELIEPHDPNDMVAKHLAAHGEGIHHIAFEVDDIGQIYETLKAQGASIVDDRVISGSRGTKCLFIAPEEFGGVHVELVQKP
jgi:methylmalonyl-CoA/ethylmalonyl-CoA epimerase